MGCDTTRLPGNGIMFICSRGQRRKRCAVCTKRDATKLCDFPLRGRKAGATCDRALCDACAVEIARVDARVEHGGGDPELLGSLTPKGRERLVAQLREIEVVNAKPDTVDFCPAHARAANDGGTDGAAGTR